jgi:FkbM family methyltransferase
MKKFLKFIAKYLVFPLYGFIGRLIMLLHSGEQGLLLAPYSWRKFLMDRYKTEKDIAEPIETLLQHLKQNLDIESQREIDQYFYRVVFAVLLHQTKTLCLPSHWCYLQTEQEKNDLLKIPPKSKDFNGSEYLEISDNGLKFLPENVLKQIEGTDFIDGGAYIGDSVRVLIKYKPNQIYAFEPDIINRQQLIKNCNKFEWKGIIPVAKGLGNSNTTAHITHNSSCTSVEVVNNGTNNENSIELTNIDTFVVENNINLGVIKLDVEGLESSIINGAIESIKKYKPVLLISIYHTPEDFFHIKPFIENLNLGYNFLVRKLSPQRAFGETMLIGFVNK